MHLAVFQEEKDKQPILVPVGHPISILMEEHRILLEYIGKLNENTIKAAKKSGFDKISDELKIMNEVADHFKKAVKHYLREENVLFPYIEKHGLSEPPAQMWIDHDKIRALEKELFDLLEAAEKKSMKFSVFKEKILTPLRKILKKSYLTQVRMS
ncbi:MAG: hemerythrin domain-containing protein [Candidatus Heimdallarchaeota archaeon]